VPSADFALAGLYAVTPEEPDTERLLRAVASAAQGGARAVQYRSKHASRELRIEQARALTSLCRSRRVPLIVNDSVEIAALVDADGVHLGRDDTAIASARRILGPGRIIGASSYDSLDLALQAQNAGADYVAFGSFFPSHVKPDAPRPPLELLTRARRALHIPVIAIGGITPANAASVINAGAQGIAVISAIFSAPDPCAAAREFAPLFDKENLVT
jgi:thiamine-phosphate pyrophosphorylase